MLFSFFSGFFAGGEADAAVGSHVHLRVVGAGVGEGAAGDLDAVGDAEAAQQASPAAGFTHSRARVKCKPLPPRPGARRY